MISKKKIVLKLFDGFNIQRWSDRVRPVNLTAMDKCASKAFISYFLGKHEEINKNRNEINKNRNIDWEFIIYGNFFSLLRNIALSDIKASIFGKIEKNKKIKAGLKDFILGQYKTRLDPELIDKFANFLISDPDHSDINYRILQAAHKLSTYQEYQIIRSANMHSTDINELDEQFNKDLILYTDIAGFNEIYFKQNLFRVLSTIDNLRNQVRWGQSARIPATSVLGHSFFCASLALLFSVELKACPKRLFNNFFCALFHDVPESLTRDIISPVKNATSGLPEIIEEIEKKLMEKKFLNLLDSSIRQEIIYFTHDEFENKIFNGEKITLLESTSELEKYNTNESNLLDGVLIKLCDDLSAFLETMQSMRYGIISRELQSGYKNILNKYTREKMLVNGIQAQVLFDELDKIKNEKF